MGAKGHTICSVMLVCLLGLTSEARAESWLNLSPTRWSTFVEFDGSFEEREDKTESSDLRLEERIKVIQGGNILDRRITNFSLEVEPTFSQGFRDGTYGGEDKTGLDLNYAGQLNILDGTNIPVAFNASASRSTGDTSGDLGSRSEFENQIWQAGVRWKSGAFPTSLTYREQSRKESLRAGLTGTTSKRDDLLRSVTLKARSSKLDIQLDRDMFDDRVRGRDNDFERNRARLHHQFRWGKGSRLATVADYEDRTGRLETRRVSVQETASIRHGKSLSSTTTYRFLARKQSTKAVQHNARFDLRHQLYRNLNTNLSLSGQVEDAEEVNRNVYGVDLNLGYTKGIPWDGRISLNAGGGFSYTDRDSAGGFLNISDERQTVPPLLTFLLDRRFVVSSSIVVRDKNLLITYTLGVDYDVRAAGGNFTEIRVIGGGGISVNDEVAISYDYENLPSASYYAVPYQFSARADFKWVSVYVRMTGREEALLTGDDRSVLTERQTSAAGGEIRWSSDATTAKLTAEVGLSDIEGLETLSYGSNQSLSHRFARTASASVSASQRFADSNNRETRLYTLDLDLRWRALRYLTVTPRLSVWRREERGNVDRTERFLRGGLDLMLHWRKLAFDLRYDHIERSGSIVDSREDRMIARLTRRF